MSSAWRVNAERLLLQADSPSVFTTAMLRGFATAGQGDPPSQSTFTRWIASMAAAGKLQEVIKGVYLNRLGHREISPAAAAHWIRMRSVVSLSWVLERAFVTNNFGDTITCVIPTHPSWPNPQIGDRKTAAGTFRFFAMPANLVDENAGKLEDIRDLRYDYPRATPEKALLDWIYLGDSPRSRMTRPPYDIDLGALRMTKLKKIARSMGLRSSLEGWLEGHSAYQGATDVQENGAGALRL